MVSLHRLVKLAALLGAVGVTATGCRGCMTENVVYEHMMNRPDPRYCGPCGPGKPCPPLIPEFEAPPGGPYLPQPAPPPMPLSVAPNPSTTYRTETIQEETFTPRRPASLVPEVVDK